MKISISAQNDLEPIDVTDKYIFICFNEMQNSNNPSEIEVLPSKIVNLVSDLHHTNADESIEVTIEGMQISSSNSHF